MVAMRPQNPAPLAAAGVRGELEANVEDGRFGTIATKLQGLTQRPRDPDSNVPPFVAIYGSKHGPTHESGWKHDPTAANRKIRRR
jgi:hypothetical protein